MEDAIGDLVAGASVSMVDKDDNEMFSGTSDENGQCVAEVTEFLTEGDTKTVYGPHTASATYGELSGLQEFTADQIQTITAVVE